MLNSMKRNFKLGVDIQCACYHFMITCRMHLDLCRSTQVIAYWGQLYPLSYDTSSGGRRRASTSERLAVHGWVPQCQLVSTAWLTSEHCIVFHFGKRSKIQKNNRNEGNNRVPVAVQAARDQPADTWRSGLNMVTAYPQPQIQRETKPVLVTQWDQHQFRFSFVVQATLISYNSYTARGFDSMFV